jgi:hypothetical protein
MPVRLATSVCGISFIGSSCVFKVTGTVACGCISCLIFRKGGVLLPAKFCEDDWQPMLQDGSIVTQNRTFCCTTQAPNVPQNKNSVLKAFWSQATDMTTYVFCSHCLLTLSISKFFCDSTVGQFPRWYECPVTVPRIANTADIRSSMVLKQSAPLVNDNPPSTNQFGHGSVLKRPESLPLLPCLHSSKRRGTARHRLSRPDRSTPYCCKRGDVKWRV